ncbi:MAG: DUF4340 domain-containing protein [Leptospirales bacterium]|nr:DUF4340 domain-containing protein [Leptospirales bacterium]
MPRINPYLVAGVAAVILIAVLILYGPGQQSNTVESYLWTRRWAAVEYAPQGGVVRYRFIRESGLFGDRYYFQAGDGRRFPGNYNVRNVFSDWQKPKLRAAYDQNPDRLKQLQLDQPGVELRFFESIGGTPVSLRLGKKTESGNTFVLSSADPGEILAVQTFLIEKFNSDPFQYRERRFLDTAGDDFISQLELVIQEPGRSDSLRLRQGKRSAPPAEGMTAPVMQSYWLRQGLTSSIEIEASSGSQVESAIRQLQIAKFNDEPDAPRLADLSGEWRRAGVDLIQLQAKTRDGLELQVSVRRPQFAGPDAEYLLVQSSLLEDPHWIGAAVVRNLIQTARQALQAPAAPPPAVAPSQPTPAGGFH